MTPPWMNTPASREAWTEQAACADVDPSIFYPDVKRSNTHRKPWLPALRICWDCQVKTECLTIALDNNEQYGVWGGTIPAERKRLRRSRRQEQSA